VGYVNGDLIDKVMPKPSADSLVLVCGPPGFMVAVSGIHVNHTSRSFIPLAMPVLGWSVSLLWICIYVYTYIRIYT
jgi:hypothetical protein